MTYIDFLIYFFYKIKLNVQNRFICIPLYVLNVKLTKGIWNRVNFFNLCLYKNKTEEKKTNETKKWFQK